MFQITNERYKGILLLLITAILWSTGGLVIKLISWEPMAIAGLRSGIAALTIFLIIRKPKFTWSIYQIGGAISLAATVILFVNANKLTTASNAILLQYTAPIFVAILGPLMLKEKVKLLDWCTILLVLGGMTLFFFDNLSTEGMLGNILAIISGLTFAMLAIFLRKQKSDSAVETILLGNIMAALIGLPFVVTQKIDLSNVFLIILLGVFQLGLPYFLYSVATKYVTALDSVLIPIIEPILNPIWVFLIIGEKPGIWALFGGIIVLFSLSIRSMITIQTKKLNLTT